MEICEDWKRAETHVFWGEIAPCDHVVQIYENDHQFLALLAEFIADGIQAGDCSIVIATAAHIMELKFKLGIFNIEELIARRKLMLLDAEETLERFMVSGWPDETLFNTVVGSLLREARTEKRQVRAFGEMVAVLWSKGFNGATVHLESLWNKFMHSQTFTLFCAYPKSGFTEDPYTSMVHICNTHTKIIASGQQKEVLYKSAMHK